MKLYDYNLLVSYTPRLFWKAKKEVEHILKTFGEGSAKVERTVASGIMGVKTNLEAKALAKKLKDLHEREPQAIQYTFKWVPIERWVESDIDSMRSAVEELAHQVGEGETWRMTVEKRRYHKLHKIEIIKELADLIDRRVNLEKPDKIVRIEIIGKYAGISVLRPEEVFSSTGSRW